MLTILKSLAEFFGFKNSEAVDLDLVNYGGQGRDKYGR
jgi:hypothetical protein